MGLESVGCACEVNKNNSVCLLPSKGQRQKKLEAKRIRDEMEEEKRKQIDKEEARYQQQKRKEAIEKAKTQLYYQTDRVRELHVGVCLGWLGHWCTLGCRGRFGIVIVSDSTERPLADGGAEGEGGSG